MYTKVVNVASTSGTQDITFTPTAGDPSWTPKVAILQWSYPNSTFNTFAEGVGRGFGFTDGTNQRCIAMVSEDNVAASDTAASQFNNALIVGHNQTGTITTIDAQAAFSAWLTNGMRITWSNAPTAAFSIQVTFLGGDDISNATVGTLMTTTGATCSVTGLPYQPDFGMFLFRNIATEGSGSSTTPQQCVGFAKSSSAQWCQSWSHADGSGTSAAMTIYSHNRVVVQHTTSVTGYSAFSTWNSDGFTLNNTDTYAVSLPIYYLVIKGGSYAVGNNTEPAGTGTDTTTTNTDVKAVGVFGLDIPTANTVTASGMWTSGFADKGLSRAALVQDELPASDPMANASVFDYTIYTNITANATAASSTEDDIADINYLSSAGFQLNWTNIGNARPYRYVTFGSSQVIVQRPIPETAVSVSDTSQPVKILYATRPISNETAVIVDTEEIERERDSERDIDDETPVIVSAGSVVATKIGPQINLYSVHFVEFPETITDTLTGITVELETITSLPKTHKYNVIAAVTVSKTHKFNTITTITNSKTHKWDLLQVITASRTHKFNIFKTVALTKTHLYNILIQITATPKTHLWNTIQKITSFTKTHKWDIQAALSQVTKSKTHLYSIINAVTSLPKTHLFSILNQISTTKIHLYYITVKVTPPAEKIHKYNVLERIDLSKTHKYSIEGEVTASRTHLFNIIETASTTKTHLWDVTQASQLYFATIDDEPAVNVSTGSISRALTGIRSIAETPTITIGDIITRVQTIIKEIAETPTISTSDSIQAGLIYTVSMLESRIKWYYTTLVHKIDQGGA